VDWEWSLRYVRPTERALAELLHLWNFRSSVKDEDLVVFRDATLVQGLSLADHGPSAVCVIVVSSLGR
jgi:hypothetical protein